ncbi:translation initiation factor 2 [Streptomyces sp. NPDC018019]|uniref:translation initiation factor 2 n=1 Tax=Streptomyces sp. NPDC018019 TaxID=3365030 RepID=UPI00379483B6
MLVAVRSAGALHRLLDVLPVFDGDERISVRFTLVPGSDFDLDALAALEHSGARTLTWEAARDGRHDLILTASPKGALRVLTGPLALLPHGAGFNKTIADDGSPCLPSGLDPHYLLTSGEPWADLYALAHDDQLARLDRYCPPAAARATVVGDPTLDRLLASAGRRESYREALGTGIRKLIALTSTWGPESLLARRPGLPGELAGRLPHDAYQLALILHPNEHSRTGSFDLSRHLAPALDAGLILAAPFEEWAAVLVAADAVVTDHGSTALYAAALGRPVIGAYDGGDELLPDSPMARLLQQVPALSASDTLERALSAAESVDTVGLAHAAFARQRESLVQLRHEFYRLLGLRPRPVEVTASCLPCPTTTPRRPAAFAVRASVSGQRISVARFATHTCEPVHHLAAEQPVADQRQAEGAAVLWRRASRNAPALPGGTWTAEGWTARILDDYPVCRTAAAILTPTRCLVRHRTAGPLSIRIEPHETGGHVLRPDPAAVVSAVHAWLGSTAQPEPPVSLVCDTGLLTVRVHLAKADASDLGYEL